MGALKITLKTFYGLEEVLRDELQEMGYERIELLNRAVQFEGTWRDVYFLNVHIRTAISVLVEIKQFTIKEEKDLYEGCAKIDWPSYFDISKSFAVKGAVFSDLFRHSQYPLLLVKDAIVDTFRKKSGDRPDVSVKVPQVMFDLYVNKNVVTISLNTSGAPLFQRGYRESVGEAPLNEVVAAGLIRLTGWDKQMPLFDPFCGSGTFLTEAALIATGVPPSVERQHFAFKNFKNFDAALFNSVQEKIDRRVLSLPCTITGSDSSAEMVTKTRRNLRTFPFGRHIETNVSDFREMKKPAERGVLITNPPYGERMGEDLEMLYEEFGNWMKHEMTNWDCWVLSANMDAMKRIGLKPSAKFKVFNGNLECTFRKFEIY